MRPKRCVVPPASRRAALAMLVLVSLPHPALAQTPTPVRTVSPRIIPTGPCAANTEFHVGAGMGDITGPAAEAGMMGYGQLDQKTAGIHQRLRARAFVILTPCNGRRVAFVSADLGQLFQGVKQQVVERLRARYPGLYSDDNVLLSATHTHDGPGGFSHYAFYNLSSLGFDEQNFDAIVDGIADAIVRAHGAVRPGVILVNEGVLTGASRNRSPGYGANPASERSQYDSDVDALMTVLRFQHADGAEIGAIAWFAVHGTSMSNANTLVSGDNKGYASYLFERAKGRNYRGGTGFVAAFAQSNEGDVTPNVFGGPDGRGKSELEATRESGEMQYARARALYDQASRRLVGGVEYRHAHVKMDAVQVEPAWTGAGAYPTCPAAIGFTMLTGTQDGPGLGEPGSSCEQSREIWKFLVCPGLPRPCQGEKQVVLEMGSLKPYPWTPEVLPLQVVTLGNLALLAVPFEATTMAGRRLRTSMLARLAPAGVDRAVIAGLANAYAGYVTTREEYAKQAYEGASTHFGPWTLAALQQEMARLADALRNGASVPAGPTPRDLRGAQGTLQTGVVFDAKPPTVAFGALVRDANPAYRRGETVRVVFWGGHPKNNLRRDGSFLEVQRLSGTAWVPVAHDWDWETVYRWNRAGCVPLTGCSHVTIEWTIPPATPAGTYRIRHDGNWKAAITGAIAAYNGFSRAFVVQ